MKSRFINITMIVSLVVLISLHLNASILFYTGSLTNNDIYNNTEIEVANKIFTDAFEAVFEMEEEPYIDDIPFDTEILSSEINYEKAIAVEFNFDEEEYIDDI
ncbi:MAG: hypothetical protein HQ521_16365 [Bacteroidetes bacterium]|nr:hypothetical protein [Bacteroidota bacterium]